MEFAASPLLVPGSTSSVADNRRIVSQRTSAEPELSQIGPICYAWSWYTIPMPLWDEPARHYHLVKEFDER